MRGWWTQPPPFDRERDAVVALREGRVVGYGDVGDQANDGSVLWLDVRGDAMDEVLAELERRARERRAPSGVVRAVADERDAGYKALLERRGYRPIRASYRMTIDLESARSRRRRPAGRRCAGGDRGRGRAAAARPARSAPSPTTGASPRPPYEEWLHWLREIGEYDPTLCFVAEHDGDPAGVVIGRVRGHGDDATGLGLGPRRPARAPRARPRHRASRHRVRRAPPPRTARAGPRGRRREHDGRRSPVRARRDDGRRAAGHLGARP